MVSRLRPRWILACLALVSTMSFAQSPTGKLVLYTSQPERDAAQTVAAFRKGIPGVDVEVFRSGTTEVMGKLAAEFSAGQPKADVLLLADAATHGGAEEGRSAARRTRRRRSTGSRPARSMPIARTSARS